MRNLMITSTILAFGGFVPIMANASDLQVEATVSTKGSVGSQNSGRVYTQGSVEGRTAKQTYDVRVRGDRNDSRDEVYEEALYEAAKKTRKKDYDWFLIVKSEINRDVSRKEANSGFETEWERVPYRDCGLLACRTEYRTERRSSVKFDFGDREESRYVVELEFKVGWGAMPDHGEVYDARHAERKYR